MRRYIISAVLALCAIGSLCATEYRWIRDIVFDAPEGGRIAYNSRNRLEMVWQDMAFIVHLLRTSGVSDDLLKRDLQRTASGYNMYDTRTYKYENGSFKGFCLEGTLPDGSTANIYNLMSKKTSLGVQVTVNYTRDSQKEAKRLIKSLKEEKAKDKKPRIKQKIQKKDAPPKPIKTPSVSPAELYEI